MNGSLISAGTLSAFFLTAHSLGLPTALWIASVAFAFCIGVFWGAGDQIRKQRTRRG